MEIGNELIVVRNDREKRAQIFLDGIKIKYVYDLSVHEEPFSVPDITIKMQPRKVMFVKGDAEMLGLECGGWGSNGTFQTFTWVKGGNTLAPLMPTAAPKIKRVIFNYPATIVFWQDGTKTVVKCGDGDEFDAEKGVLLCIMKKLYGNKQYYYDALQKAVDKAEIQHTGGKNEWR